MKVSCHQYTEDQVPTVCHRCPETRVHHFRLTRGTLILLTQDPGRPTESQPHPQMSTRKKCFETKRTNIYRVYRAKIKRFPLLRMRKSTINLNALENKCVIDKDIFLFLYSPPTDCIKGNKQQ